jgi:hypothetical protein
MKQQCVDPGLLKRFEEGGIPCAWHVYALKDPRDGAVRYVGITFHPEQRLRGHLSERSDTRKCAWIAELRQLGLVPGMRILESGDGGWCEQSECEQRWIAHYRPPLNQRRAKHINRATPPTGEGLFMYLDLNGT